MSILDRSALQTDINNNIYNNPNRDVSGADVADRLINIIDSFVSKYGDSGILALLQYSATHAISDNKDLVHKKYVDDLITALNAITQGTNTLIEPLILNGNPIQTNNDIEITDITKGIIMTDQDGSGNRYRITILGASFNFELLP